MWKYWLLVIILAPVIYNVDVITGTYKFNKLCEAEGGAHFYRKIKRNVGWRMPNNPHLLDYRWPFDLLDVQFVRYQDEDGKWADVYQLPPDGTIIRNYRFESVDSQKQPVYEFKFERMKLADKRMAHDKYIVTEIASGKVFATFTKVSFAWTSPDRTLLAAPTTQTCPNNNIEYTEFTRDLFDKGI